MTESKFLFEIAQIWTYPCTSKKCLSDEGWTQEKDSWDIVITDDKGDTVTLYCFGDNAVLTADLTGEGV